MVCTPLLREMEIDLNKNIERYISEHPGKILVYDDSEKIKLFFNNIKEADEYLKKYEGLYGPTFLTKEIPKSIEEYKKQLEKEENWIPKFLEHLKEDKRKSLKTIIEVDD